MTSVGPNMSDPRMAYAAAAYAARLGQRRSTNYDHVVVNPEFGQRLAGEYQAARTTPEAVASYHALRHEVGKQFDYLTRPKHRGGLGVEVNVQHNDPYARLGAWGG